MGLGTVADKSMFVQLLIEGTNPSTAVSKANLDGWINTIKVPFTIARDPDGAPPFTLRSSYGVKETTYIIDRATRKILFKNTSTAAAFEKLQTMP